jgi:hypothetical protein
LRTGYRGRRKEDRNSGRVYVEQGQRIGEGVGGQRKGERDGG